MSVCVCVCVFICLAYTLHIPWLPFSMKMQTLISCSRQIRAGSEVDVGSDRIIISRQAAVAASVSIVIVAVAAAVDDKTGSRRAALELLHVACGMWQLANCKLEGLKCCQSEAAASFTASFPARCCRHCYRSFSLLPLLFIFVFFAISCFAYWRNCESSGESFLPTNSIGIWHVLPVCQWICRHIYGVYSKMYVCMYMYYMCVREYV